MTRRVTLSEAKGPCLEACPLRFARVTRYVRLRSGSRSQNRYRPPSWNCRGSPRPLRSVPSKLRKTAADADPEVVGVGDVEHLEDGLERALAAEVERPGEPNVPGEESVVLPDRVPLEDVAVGADALRLATRRAAPVPCVVRAADLGGRLRRVRADPVVEVEIAGQHGQQPGVEPVPLVAVAPVVLRLQRIRLGIAEGERIALVVVVGLVERERVVHLELEVRDRSVRRSSAVKPLKRDLALLCTTKNVPDAVRSAVETGGPGPVDTIAEHRVVGVEEAGQVVGSRVGVAERPGQPRRPAPARTPRWR